MKISNALNTVKTINKLKKKKKESMKNSSSSFDKEQDNISKLAEYVREKEVQLIVKEKIFLKDNVVSLTLKGETAIPPFASGQYLSIKLNLDGNLTSRPYYFASSFVKSFLDEPEFEILIERTEDSVAAYLCDSLEKGDKLTAFLPYGEVFYDSIRDSKNVVAIANGISIAPVLSLARSLADGAYDIDLTIVYTAEKFEDLLYYEELKSFNTHFILSNVPHENIPFGLIDKKLLKEISKADSTYFIFGFNEFNDVIRTELLKIKVPNRRIRCNIDSSLDYTVSKIERYYIKVVLDDQITEINAKNSSTILLSLEEAGIPIQSTCRGGKCGACLFKLLEGKVYVANNDYRRQAEIEYNYYHACSTYPLSNITIRIHKKLI